jgi:hypothetical protein
MSAREAYPHHYDCGHWRGTPRTRAYEACPPCIARDRADSRAIAKEVGLSLLAWALIAYAIACACAAK